MIMFIRLDTTITAYDRQTDTEHTGDNIIYRSGVTSCDKIRCRAKSDVSPPGCATSRLRPATPMHGNQQNLVAVAMSLEGSKNLFQIDCLQP